MPGAGAQRHLGRDRGFWSAAQNWFMRGQVRRITVPYRLITTHETINR